LVLSANAAKWTELDFKLFYARVHAAAVLGFSAIDTLSRASMLAAVSDSCNNLPPPDGAVAQPGHPAEEPAPSTAQIVSERALPEAPPLRYDEEDNENVPPGQVLAELNALKEHWCVTLVCNGTN
jgi:hypothetical protein